MKKFLLLATIGFMVASCESNTQITENHDIGDTVILQQPPVEYKLQVEQLIVKDLKTETTQSTDYDYQFDALNTLLSNDIKIRQQPNVHTNTKYYVIYTNHTHEEISKDKYLDLSIGDTIIKYKNVPK